MDIKLKPKYQYELLRIGNKNDGGYLVEKSSFQNSDFLSGIVIEFHDVDLNKDKIIDFSNKLNLELVHIHANNFGGVDSKNNPLVLEISYSRNPKKIGNFPKIPNVLDRPNDTKRREVNLIFTEK